VFSGYYGDFQYYVYTSVKITWLKINDLKCRIVAVLGSTEHVGKSTMIGANVAKPHTTYIVIYIYYISVVRMSICLKILQQPDIVYGQK